MSITVKFYTFDKRPNSTCTPTGGTSYNCLLKEPCGILNPRIELERSSDPSALNYAYISAFSRYYWVTEWTSDHGRWIANLSVDPLASWKSAISNSYQFVTRSGSNSDSYIIDGKYMITTDVDIANIDVVDASGKKRPFLKDGNDMKYIISTTNGGDTGALMPPKLSGASYYALTPGEAWAFTSYLLDDPTYLSLNVDEISDSLAKGIINPLQYIGDAYILPYAPDETLVGSNLMCGWWPVDVDHVYNALPLGSDLHKWKIFESNQIQIPSHPQTSVVGQFVNSPGYTSVTLFAGIFGTIPIDSLLTARYEGWKIEVYGDFKGKAELDIYFYDPMTTSYVLWERHYAESAVPMAISQLTSNIGSSAAGAGKGAAGAIKSTAQGNIGGIFSSLASGIKSLVGGMAPTPSGQSIANSIAYLLDDFYVQTEHHIITETAPGLLGAPLCQVKQLSELSGFCQVDDPVISAAATQTELESILSSLRGGIFLE